MDAHTHTLSLMDAHTLSLSHGCTQTHTHTHSLSLSWMYTHTLMDAHTQTNTMKTPKALCETCNLQWQSCFLCNHHAPWNRWHWHGMSARLEPKYVPAQSACRCLSTALVPTGKTPPKSYCMRACECVHACKQVCMCACVCVCVHVSLLHGPRYILSVCKCVSYGILNLFWTPTQTDRTMDLCKKTTSDYSKLRHSRSSCPSGPVTAHCYNGCHWLNQ